VSGHIVQGIDPRAYVRSVRSSGTFGLCRPPPALGWTRTTSPSMRTGAFPCFPMHPSRPVDRVTGCR